MRGRTLNYGIMWFGVGMGNIQECVMSEMCGETQYEGDEKCLLNCLCFQVRKTSQATLIYFAQENLVTSGKIFKLFLFIKLIEIRFPNVV